MIVRLFLQTKEFIGFFGLFFTGWENTSCRICFSFFQLIFLILLQSLSDKGHFLHFSREMRKLIRKSFGQEEIGMQQKIAVIFGAGRVGRGFAAEVLQSAGYHLFFVERNLSMVEQLRKNGFYMLYKAGQVSMQGTPITDFTIVHESEEAEICEAIASPGAIASICMPSNALPHAAEMMCIGLARRAMERPDEAIDILLCLNAITPKSTLRNCFEQFLGGSALEYARSKVGIVDTVVMRMCPEPTQELKNRDSMAVITNGYHVMPADRSAFCAEPPKTPMLRLTNRIEAEAARKMLTLNMGHAALAYLGAPLGYYWAIDALRNPDVYDVLKQALEESAIGLCGEYGFHMDTLRNWNEMILLMLDAPHLRDTLSRLGADTRRKLSDRDRLVTAANLCVKHGGNPEALCKIIAHAYKYAVNQDMGTSLVMQTVKEDGIESAMEHFSNIGYRHPLKNSILSIYETLPDIDTLQYTLNKSC